MITAILYLIFGISLITAERPRIIPEIPERTLSPDEKQPFECRSNQKEVSWILPINVDPNLYNIIGRSEGKSKILELDCTDVNDPAQTLVGYYYCVDKQLETEFIDLSNDEIVELLERRYQEGEISRIYIFLEDAALQLAGPENNVYKIDAVLGTTIWLPCRPTSKRINKIRLSDDGNLNDIFEPDPYRGIALNLTIPNDFRDYKCSVDDTEESIYVQVNEIVAPPRPIITADDYAFGVENGELKLRCSAGESDDEITYRWEGPKKTGITNEDRNKTLILSNLRKAYDEGIYTCIVENVKNRGYRNQASIAVNVSATDSYICLWESAHSDRIVVTDNKLVIAVSYVSFPHKETVTWTGPDGYEISETNGVRIERFNRAKDSSTVLYIDDLQPSQIGRYVITIDNGIEQKSLSVNVQKENDMETVAPKIFVDEEWIIKPNDYANVVFVVCGKPIPEMEFVFHENCKVGRMNCNGKRTILRPAIVSNGSCTTYTLKFKPSGPGRVVGTAKSLLGDHEKSSSIVILENGRPFGFAPFGDFVKNMKKNIRCYASKNQFSEHNIKIRFNGRDLSIHKQETALSYIATFSKRIDVTEKSEGIYECLATDKNGSQMTDSTNVSLNEFKSLEIRTNAENVVFGNGPLVLSCVATGMPVPVIRWYKQDNSRLERELKEDDMHRISFNSTSMIIEHPQLSDVGTYICKATNYFGSKTERFRFSAGFYDKCGSYTQEPFLNDKLVTIPSQLLNQLLNNVNDNLLLQNVCEQVKHTRFCN